MNVFEIVLDVDKRENDECVYLRQGDVNGTTFKATLRDHGGPFEDDEYTAAFCMTLPDRKSYYWTEATYESGIVSVLVDERIAASVPGSTTNAYFELYKGDELKYTTASFLVRVRPSATEVGKAAKSYDVRIERLMDSLRTAIHRCVAPTVSVEDVDDAHVVTIVTPSGESSFTVADGVDGADGKDGANGEKGEKGDKGDTGDPTQPNSIGMAQLTDEVRSRIGSKHLTGTITEAKPTVDDALPATILGATVLGNSTQDSTPSKDNPSPISSVDSVSIECDGDDWPMVVDIRDDELRGLSDGHVDELTIDEYGNVILTQRVGVIDLGSLTWAKTETKTGGLSRYYSTGLNTSLVAPSSNIVVAPIMCDALRVTSYTDTYNRVVDGCVGVSSAGTIGVYLEAYAGSLRTPAEFTEAVSGTTLLYAMRQPVTRELGTIELPSLHSSNVTVSCNAPFSILYERDIYLVVQALADALGV